MQYPLSIGGPKKLQETTKWQLKTTAKAVAVQVILASRVRKVLAEREQVAPVARAAPEVAPQSSTPKLDASRTRMTIRSSPARAVAAPVVAVPVDPADRVAPAVLRAVRVSSMPKQEGRATKMTMNPASLAPKALDLGAADQVGAARPAIAKEAANGSGTQ